MNKPFNQSMNQYVPVYWLLMEEVDWEVEGSNFGFTSTNIKSPETILVGKRNLHLLKWSR